MEYPLFLIQNFDEKFSLFVKKSISPLFSTAYKCGTIVAFTREKSWHDSCLFLIVAELMAVILGIRRRYDKLRKQNDKRQ